MSYLIPIKYLKKNYPSGILPKINEVPLHFDVKPQNLGNQSSLHTEYSYGPRKLSSQTINGLPIIRESHQRQIPRLWFCNNWSKEFARFIKLSVGLGDNIKIIEIHPPFKDYCSETSLFIERYKIFEEEILSFFPKSEILIEHRNGSLYKGAGFLFSKNNDLLKLSEEIYRNNLNLRLILDIPQLFAAHFNSINFSEEDIILVLNEIKQYRKFIRGIHIWGKKRNIQGRWSPHVGDLNTYFNFDRKKKNTFLNELYNVLNDENTRYFVPEVNSKNDDLKSIVSDFIDKGFKFVNEIS